MLQKLQPVISQQLYHNGRIFVNNSSPSNWYSNTFFKSARCIASSAHINERPAKGDANILLFSINNKKYTRDCNISKMESISFRTHNHVSTLSKMSYNANNILARSNTSRCRLVGVRHFSDLPNMEQSWYNNLFHSISCSAPVEFAQNLLLSIHSAIGLPWWAVIMLSTISVKAFISLPLAVFQEHNKAKLKKAMLEINEKKIELRPEAIYAVTAQGLSKRQSQLIYRKKLRDEWTQILIKHNCHPAKNFILSIIQLPIWVILSVSIRNLCHMLPMHNESAYTTYMELKKGGFGWIQDLTEIDSLLLFPICAGIFNLLCLEMQLILNERKDTSLKFFMVNFSRIVIIIFTGVGMNISSAITMYWTTSSASSFLQNILLLSPKFRRLMGVPKMDSELQHPYLHLQKEINRKLNFVKRLTNLQGGFNVKRK